MLCDRCRNESVDVNSHQFQLDMLPVKAVWIQYNFDQPETLVKSEYFRQNAEWIIPTALVMVTHYLRLHLMDLCVMTMRRQTWWTVLQQNISSFKQRQGSPGWGMTQRGGAVRSAGWERECKWEVVNGSQIGGSESLVLATGVPELGGTSPYYSPGYWGVRWRMGWWLQFGRSVVEFSWQARNDH